MTSPSNLPTTIMTRLNPIARKSSCSINYTRPFNVAPNVDESDNVTVEIDSTFGGSITVEDGLDLDLEGVQLLGQQLDHRGQGRMLAVNTGTLDIGGNSLSLSGMLSNGGTIDASGEQPDLLWTSYQLRQHQRGGEQADRS